MDEGHYEFVACLLMKRPPFKLAFFVKNKLEKKSTIKYNLYPISKSVCKSAMIMIVTLKETTNTRFLFLRDLHGFYRH